MGKLLNLAIYNPALLSSEDFLAGFVARNRLAEQLISRLADIKKSNLAQHQLLLGQRGMGKTSLLRRLAIGIEQDTKLSKVLLPLTFREEQYNVHNLSSFWYNCLDALGDYYENTKQFEKAEQIDLAVNALSKDHGDGDQILVEFKKWMRKEGRRPVLLLDNIDIILNGLQDDQWALRRVFQEAGGVIVIGASTSYMEAVSDKEAAFYDFFQVTLLEKLSQEDLLVCLKRLANARKEEGARVLKIIEEDPGRIRTLYDLTGGNPRTLTLLYLLLEMDGESNVFADLESLLDQVTVLYKARVEDLSPQARVVIDALALAWDPITAASLSAITKLSKSKVSTHLNRLFRDGLIEKVSISTSKKNAFQIGERFFNIWYLMRHAPRRQRTRLKWLTGFLRTFYTPKQLTDRAKEFLLKESIEYQSKYDYCVALSDAIVDAGWRNLLGSEASNILANEDASQVISLLKSEEVPSPKTAEEWTVHGRLLSLELGRHEDAKAAFEKAIGVDPKAAETWKELGDLFKVHLKDFAEAERAYKSAIKNDTKWIKPRVALGRLHLDTSKNFEVAEKVFNEIIEIEPLNKFAHLGLADLRAETEQYKSAEITYRKVVEIDPKYSYAWNQLGRLYHYKTEDYKKASAAYKNASKNSKQWAYPKYLLGNLYHHYLNDKVAARKSYEEAIEKAPMWVAIQVSLAALHFYQFDDLEKSMKIVRKALEIRPNDVPAKYLLADLLHYGKENLTEAELLYKEILVLDPKHARVLVELGNLYRKVDRYKDAEEAYKESLELDDQNHRAWEAYGFLLAFSLKKYNEAEKAFIRALEIDETIELTTTLADLQQNRLNKTGQAMALYQRALEMEANSYLDFAEQSYISCFLFSRYDNARALARKAIALNPENLAVKTNVMIMDILNGELSKSEKLEEFNVLLKDHSEAGCLLLTALVYLVEDNFGSASETFNSALKINDPEVFDIYRGLFVLFCRVVSEKGYGEKFLEKFVDDGLSDMYWPIYAALNAYLNGENKLLDVNPEVRGVATHILNWLRVPKVSEEY